jgi:hypothetical protein
VKDALETEKTEPGKAGITEWLFSDDTGQIAENVSVKEIETIYNGYIQQLIGSYE